MMIYKYLTTFILLTISHIYFKDIESIHSVYNHCYNPSPELFHLFKLTLYPLHNNPPLSSPEPLGATILLSISMNLTTLG